MCNIDPRPASRRFGLLLLVLFMLAFLSACEQPVDDEPNIVNDKMSFALPIQINSVEKPQNLTVFAYIKESASNGAETKIPLISTVNGGQVTASGTTNIITANKSYDLRLEIFYTDQTQALFDLNILNSPSKNFTTTSLGGNLVEGRVNFTNNDFADRNLYPDDDLDGYSNLDEINIARGDGRTNPHNSFDFPNNNTIINSPKNISIVVCPRLNTNTLAQITNKYNYPNLDYRDCSKDNSVDFTVMHSADQATDLTMLMALDLNFSSIPMTHKTSQFSTGAPTPYTLQYKHGVLPEGSSYFNTFDTNCIGAVCDNIANTRPSLNLATPVAPMFFISTPARSPDQTKFLPTWIRLEPAVDEVNHTSYIKISWERIYNDDAGNYKMELKRSYQLADVANQNQWSPSSDTAVGSFTGKTLQSPETIATGFKNDSIFNLESDSSNFESLSFTDTNVKGGVIYYYQLVTTEPSNNVVSSTSPIGVSNYAAIPYIDEFPANNYRGDVTLSDIDNGQGGIDVKISLNAPVAYGTQLDIYYIPGDNTTLASVNKDTFKTECGANGTYPTCVHRPVTNNPYELTITSSDTPTRVLVEKTDRFGRFAGYQIHEIVH